MTPPPKQLTFFCPAGLRDLTAGSGIIQVGLRAQIILVSQPRSTSVGVVWLVRLPHKE